MHCRERHRDQRVVRAIDKILTWLGEQPEEIAALTAGLPRARESAKTSRRR
jgi:hypothetical protein